MCLGSYVVYLVCSCVCDCVNVLCVSDRVTIGTIAIGIDILCDSCVHVARCIRMQCELGIAISLHARANS